MHVGPGATALQAQWHVQRSSVQQQHGPAYRATDLQQQTDEQPSACPPWTSVSPAATLLCITPALPHLPPATCCLPCQVVRGSVWTFEQTQALDFFDVYTPVRMTVIKLKSGGLWVHAPVAPTDECLRLLRELDAPVEYIVLPTFAYEHKVFVGPFSRKFPKAKVGRLGCGVCTANGDLHPWAGCQPPLGQQAPPAKL